MCQDLLRKKVLCKPHTVCQIECSIYFVSSFTSRKIKESMVHFVKRSQRTVQDHTHFAEDQTRCRHRRLAMYYYSRFSFLRRGGEADTVSFVNKWACFSIYKLRTSAGFKLGSSEQEQTTLTTADCFLLQKSSFAKTA